MTLERVAGIAAVAAVAAGLVAGFAVTGSPSHARSVQLDSRRIDDVKTIAGRLDELYVGNERKKPLPAQLPDGVRALRRDGSDATRDPVTAERYGYAVAAPGRYRICVTFATAVAAGDQEYGSWPHEQGRVCYHLSLGQGFNQFRERPPDSDRPSPPRRP